MKRTTMHEAMRTANRRMMMQELAVLRGFQVGRVLGFTITAGFVILGCVTAALAWVALLKWLWVAVFG